MKYVAAYEEVGYVKAWAFKAHIRQSGEKWVWPCCYIQPSILMKYVAA